MPAFDVYHYVTGTKGLAPADVFHLTYKPPRTAQKYRPAGKHLALAPNEALLKVTAPVDVVFGADIAVTWRGQKVAPSSKVELQFEVVDGPTGSDGYELAHANGDNLDLSAYAGPISAQTPPQFDNDTSVPTTEWVRRQGVQYSSRVNVLGATTLGPTAAGAFVAIQAAVVVTLPLANTFPAGGTISFMSLSTGASILCQGADLLNGGSVFPASVPINAGDTLELVSNGIGSWAMNGGSVQLPNAAQMSSWPLAPQFDSSGKLATTAWVQRRGLQLSGFNIYAADTVLTAAQAGSRVQLRDNVTLTLPASDTVAAGAQIWFYGQVNGLLKVNPAAPGDLIYHGGIGSATLPMGVADTAVLSCYGGGLGWVVDAGSLQLPGSAVMAGANWVTQPQFDNSQRLANTAFVQRALGNHSNVLGIYTDATLTAAHAGYHLIAPNNASTITLPLVSTLPNGATISFMADSNGGFVKPQGADNIFGVANPKSVPMGTGDTLTLVSHASGWYVQDGSARLPVAAQMNNWPTAPQFDRSGKLATTQFVMRALGSFNNVGQIPGPLVLDASYAGWYITLTSGAAPTLPKVSTVPVGQAITLQNITGGAAVLVTAAAGDVIINPVTGVNIGTFSLPAGKYMSFISGGGLQWYATGTGA